MISFQETCIDQIVLHKVGNKSQDDGVKLSEATIKLDESIKELLLTYFLSPFKSEEYF